MTTAPGKDLTVRSQARSRLLLAPLIAALLVLGAVPASASETATSSDAAGDAYKTSIAKAKGKRAAKLKACAKKPKAKRAACRKSANTAFATAKQKAKDRRDAARNPGSKGDGGPPESRYEEYFECVKAGGDPTECKEAAKGGKGSK